MISDRAWPVVGQKLTHRNPRTKHEVTAEVVFVDTARRRVGVRVGSQIYPSLSTAARAITGNSTNGWVFWGLKQKR